MSVFMSLKKFNEVVGSNAWGKLDVFESSKANRLLNKCVVKNHGYSIRFEKDETYNQFSSHLKQYIKCRNTKSANRTAKAYALDMLRDNYRLLFSAQTMTIIIEKAPSQMSKGL